MGIISNTVSLCHFQVKGDIPADLVGFVGERLSQNAFSSIDQGAEEASIGWVCLGDLEKADFDNVNDWQRDRYLCFSLRRDQRKVSPALVRREFDKACKAFLAENPGFARVPKQKKEELREIAKDGLLQRTLPSPCVFDAVWDVEKGLVAFASTSAKAIESFEGLFRASFEPLRLVRLHPYARASQLVPEEMADALSEANQSSTDAVLELIKENVWLGQDFFRFLLYQSLHGSSEYPITVDGPQPQGEQIIAYVNDKLSLTNGQQKVNVSGPQEHWCEVRTALSQEKQIAAGTIYLEHQEDCWKLTLKGEDFCLSGYKCPSVKIEKDETSDEASERQAIFYERMHLIESGLQMFDSVFLAFLRQRLSAGWPRLAQQIHLDLCEA